MKNEQETRKIFSEEGVDIESGMEYLNGLEVIVYGVKMYRLEDIERFINR